MNAIPSNFATGPIEISAPVNGRKRVAVFVDDEADPDGITIQLTRKVRDDDPLWKRGIARAFGGGALFFLFDLKIETARALHRVLGEAIAESDRRMHRRTDPIASTIIDRKSGRSTLWNRFYGRWLTW